MADNWTLTIDTGGGQVSTDYSTWASMIAAIAASKASLVYCKIKQNGSPTLPTTFYNLFSGFSKLTTLIFDGVDTSSVTETRDMFANCSLLASIDFGSGWNMGSVTSANGMFYGCSSFTDLDLSGWDVKNLLRINGLLLNCTSLITLDLSGWNTVKVWDMAYVMNGCSSLETIYADEAWTTAAVTSSLPMFTGCVSLVGAIAFDPTKTDHNYANYTTGYFTYKAPPVPEPTIRLTNRIYRMNSPHQIRRIN